MDCKRKRDIFRTWFHSFEKETVSQDTAQNNTSHSVTKRSKGLPPHEFYDDVCYQDAEEQNNIDRCLSEFMETHQQRSSSRKRLVEISLNLKNNFQRRSPQDVPEDSLMEDTTIDTVSSSSISDDDSDEDPEKLSCYRSFRTNAVDLSVLFDNEINRSMGDLAIVNTNKNAIFQSPFQDILEKSFSHLDIFQDDVLVPVSPYKSARFELPEESECPSLSTAESTSVDDRDEDANVSTPGSSPMDDPIVQMGKTQYSTLRCPKALIPEINGENCQTEKVQFTDLTGDIYDLYNSSESSLSGIKECSVPPVCSLGIMHTSSDATSASDLQLSAPPSLMEDSGISTEYSRSASDHSQTFTIPTFRKGSELETVADVMTSLRSGAIDEKHLALESKRSMSFTCRDFYDRLPNGYFDDPMCHIENFDDDRDSIYEEQPVVGNNTNATGGSVRFNDESKLLLYTPQRKVETIKLNQLDSARLNSSRQPKSILKTKHHDRMGLETERALMCDTVDVQTFLQIFMSNEKRRGNEEQKNVVSRERQLNRYYANGIALNRFTADDISG